jgi:hypothetical protein
LREWINADRAGLKTHHRLIEAAQEWADAPPEAKESYLYTGARLALATEWAASHYAELSALEAEFLSASRSSKPQQDSDVAGAKHRSAQAATGYGPEASQPPPVEHPPTRPKVFISYRRSDSQESTGRLYDRLVARLGGENVFIDIDSISFGTNFREHIAISVEKCDVLLAVIGERWLTDRRKGGLWSVRRLDDPADFVRVEIESALKRGIPVVPVLVGAAAMPAEKDLPKSLKELACLNAAQVRPGRDFTTDVERLIKFLDSLAARG